MVASPTLEQQRYTVDEFLAFVQASPQAESRYELIEGALEEMASSNKINTIIAGVIIAYLNLFVLPGRLGYVSSPDGGFRLSRQTYLMPDVGYIRKERVPTLEGQTFEGAPDLAVEVISPNENASSVLRKTRLYLEHGAQYVWSIYPQEQVVYVSTLNPDGSLNLRLLNATEELTCEALLPGFRLAIKDIFAVL
jgi:Uma2 family endonuclease